MVFICTLCSAMTPRQGRRTTGKLTLKAHQLEAVRYLLGRALESEAAPHVAALKEGALLCVQCFPETLRSQITRRQGPGGEMLVGESLVGQPTAVWDGAPGGAGMRLGKVTDQLPTGGVCTVTWTDPPPTTTETLSIEMTKDFCKLGAYIQACKDDTAKACRMRSQAAERQARARERSKAAAEAAPEEMCDSSDTDEEEDDADEPQAAAPDGEDTPLTPAELALARRCLSRINIFNPAWWQEQGPMGAKLHQHLFNFPSHGQMRHFFNHAFRHWRKEPKCYGLSPFELMSLALLKMKTGKSWLEIEGLMGALRGKGFLTRRISTWIHRLGSFSKQSLVGIPTVEYMDDCIPQIYRDCDMSDSFQIGDGTVFLTETPRRGIFKTLKNQLWNDKTHHAGRVSVVSVVSRADLFTANRLTCLLPTQAR